MLRVGPMSTDIQSDYSSVSALDLPHEFRGRSDRECQDLRLGRLGVPRPARIAARLTLCPRDLPGLRIRLTTVPCILPERLELTWCHRGICRRDRLIIAFYIGFSVIAQVVEVHRIHHRASLNLHASKSVGWKFLRSFTGENFGTGQNTGKLCRIFGRSLREY
ncbi:F-box family protein with DUF295 [Prunus dulcis]|uniref:F-box family protein with DUF295 n=1 Tax=Prunus dulcis TaxID=3755 RepID=A0A4Y1QPY4_PRUDU|nr:F-box family protein with DUF295 [Prunus dulcis]